MRKNENMNERRLNERETSVLEPTLNTSQMQLIFDFAGFADPFSYFGTQDLDIVKRYSKENMFVL